MAIEKKNKDHLGGHESINLIGSIVKPTNNTQLRFWTEHPLENTLIDLYPFADGQFENPHPRGGGAWGGPYTGRPKLIAELAPAIHARLFLLRPNSTSMYLSALRTWWRLFDRIEKASSPDGKILKRVESVCDLNTLHEAAAHQSGMLSDNFRIFLSIVNATRKLHTPRLPDLPWVPPKAGSPARTLIPEDQARAIKTCLKQAWEQVRRTWARNDAIRTEAERRVLYAANLKGTHRRLETTSRLSENDQHLLKSLEYLQSIQRKTGKVLPNGKQLLDGVNRLKLWEQGIEMRTMRAIIFPTVEEADVAFHLALMNSGWNPSTMANLNGSSPSLIFDHPKDISQSVLSIDDEHEELTMRADKPRARGKTQFCVGLKKNTSSPPVIVATYLQRVAPLREQLQFDYHEACIELERLQTNNEIQQTIVRQYKLVQRLRRGCRSVWLYVDSKGEINWLEGANWKRYANINGNKNHVSYLDKMLERLNEDRARRGESSIPSITPSDFRDIFARWVYVQTAGNILAVMLALGHSSLKSTGRYIDNNIFSAENDEHSRRFMTDLFTELKLGRIDLSVLTQLVRHGPLTPEMQDRLNDYRKLIRSRVGVACTDPHKPPAKIAPHHHEGKLCGIQNCLRECVNARFLPESLDGIAMRVEELNFMSDLLPRETWLQGQFEEELESGEYILNTLYPSEQVVESREKWRSLIARGDHMVPGIGFAGDPPREHS